MGLTSGPVECRQFGAASPLVQRQRGKLPSHADDIVPFILDHKQKENIDPFANDADHAASLLTRSTFLPHPAAAKATVEAAFLLTRSAPASSVPALVLPDGDDCMDADDDSPFDECMSAAMTAALTSTTATSTTTASPTLSFRHSTFQPFAAGFAAPSASASSLDTFPASLASQLRGLLDNGKEAYVEAAGVGAGLGSAPRALAIDWAALDRRASQPGERPALFADLDVDEEGRMVPASPADIAVSAPRDWMGYAAVRVREM